MARSHSSEDSDSSLSASSSTSGDENIAIASTMQPTDPNPDPESPNAAHQSADESGSSDGVLVELPSNNDQDSRSLPGDPDNGGVLVNIDGSMQEHQEREDQFVDASDHIGSEVRTPKLGESAAMVDVGETSRRRRSREQDLERVQARLDASSAECRKFMEDREAFGTEVVALRTELRKLMNQQFLNSEELAEYHRRLENRQPEHDVFASPASLHSMVKDCSIFVVHLKGVLDERLNTDGAMLDTKDQEIEVLNAKILEFDVFRDVLISYLGSVSRECSQTMHEYINVIESRLLASIPVINGKESVSSEEEFVDAMSLIEKRTMLLVEKHNKLLLEVEQLSQFVEEVKPGSLATQENELGLVIAVVREGLLESKKKEGELEERIRELEEENMKLDKQIACLDKGKEEADAEMSKLKTELEQSESRFLAAKEKLSIAVTKGKQLVQHRDSLKQSLADKTTELEKCTLDLQQKVNALETMGAGNEELMQLLSVKTSELEKCVVDLQNKSNLLEISETTIEDQKQLLHEKTSELEKCLLEVQLKSDAFNTANKSVEEFKWLLAENKDQLENCLLELQQKSRALETAEANAEELKQSFTEKNCELEQCLLSLKQNGNALETALAAEQQLKQELAEKDIELEKSLLELQEKTVLAMNALTFSKELSEAQHLVHSLQELASNRDKTLNDIEGIIHDTGFPQDLLSLDIVDKLRWLATKTHISDEILQENHRARKALFSVGVPEDISAAELDSQVDWLVRSFTQSKDELSKLQSELTHTSTLHESEVSEALKEVDSIAESLMKEKEEKESILIELEDLKINHERLAENLALISSEKARFIEFLKEVTETKLGDQLPVDMDALLEKSIVYLRDKMKISLNGGKKLESMQKILHVTHVELTLVEKIVEELQMDGLKMTNLSDRLGTALEEVYALRNEKDSMQKELERLEEKNSLIRDKLSMAVKKGKGLVQEREVFKLTLAEKNSEIGKLKEELQLQESKVYECSEQIKNLSAYPEQVLKLEVDIASLKDEKGQIEHLLNESNENLKKLVDFINDIVVHTEKIFEAPIDKVDWISGRITETENANAYLEQELEKVKVDAALNSKMLAEALETMKALEMELQNKEKHIYVINDEKNSIQVSKTKAEEEREKAKEENFIQANKLTDAYATIKSLEDTLSSAEDKVSAIDSEKNKIVSKSNLEISAINAKLAECMEELAKTRGNSENQSSELLSELRKLQIFMKNEGPFPLMIEQFRKKAEGLKHMWMLVNDIHDNFVAKGLHIQSKMKQIPAFTNLSSLPSFEDFINNETFHTESILEDADAVTSCKKIVEKLCEEARLVNGRFTGLSKYIDDHITFILQALQGAKDEFIHALHLSESLKLNIEKLEARNQAQEFEISSLKTEATSFLSACSDATKELHVKVFDLLCFDSELEDVHSDLVIRSPAFESKVEREDASEFAQAADNFLLTCRRVITQSQNLVKINKDMSNSLETLKQKLNHAEMTAETTVDERNLIQERVLKLEEDMDALQNVCNEMKVKLNDYQSKEDLIKRKEDELKRLEHSLTAQDRGAGDEMISKGQVEVLFDKINKLIVLAGSFRQSKSQNQEIYFSSPIDKLFYVVDKFSEFQQGVYSLTCENEDLQLALANRVYEIENLKNASETISVDHHDLELKKRELSEVTGILEKIMQQFAGNYSFEDLKPVTALGLIRVLERQMIALSVDLENSKSEVHELGGKLQAKDMIANELSAKIKYLEDSHARIQQPDVKERTLFESSVTVMRPEITEIEEGSVGMSSKAPSSASAHVRTTRKGSNEHLVLNIDPESEQLIASHETDDKGHVFKSLNTSGLIPRQARLLADRVDGIWVAGGRILMSKPGARLGLIGYWIFLHLWLLGSIL